MNGDQHSALTAMRTVEPIAARLDRSRDGEDRAADILELWQGTETALRALMGGSSLSGQGLIRELRQREMISLGQAYALLEFLGARDRANRTTYRATDNDVVVAREGYRQLEAGLVAAAAQPQSDPVEGAPPLATQGADYSRPASASVSAAAASAAVPPAHSAGAARPTVPPMPPSYGNAPPPAQATPAPGYSTSRKRPPNFWFIVALAVLVLAAIGGYTVFARRPDPDKQLNEAVAAMQAGRREAARGAFSQIARENPQLATPHIFLSRLAREEGDLGSARRELETALRLDPRNGIALREMGLILFSAGQYELARRFFVRALQANPEDKASMGYLGCALARLNRFEEAQRFIGRAGAGSWSSCLPPTRPL